MLKTPVVDLSDWRITDGVQTQKVQHNYSAAKDYNQLSDHWKS